MQIIPDQKSEKITKIGACKQFSLSIYANNNNNSHDNVYGAVVMTKVIARVHPVHLMNVD